jgi:transcriptional regulator with XRE-family HTH domain
MHMVELIEVGRRLQEERRRLALTQEELAGRVDVSRAAVATYEAGRTPFDITFLNRLQAAGVRVNYVLSGRADSEVANDMFDWNIAESVFLAIHDFAQEAGLTLSPKKQFALLRVLYLQAAREKQVDARAVEVATRMAA